jgi:Skp family chaperone for outer membrane proteins
MKKTVAYAFGFLAVLTVGMPFGAAQAADETAYIDMSAAFQGYYRTQQSESQLKEQEDAYKARAQELAEEMEAVRKQRDELQEKALNVALSEEVRKQSRGAAQMADRMYQERQQELRNFYAEKQQELREKYLQMRDEIVKEILDTVRQFAAEQGYAVVLDVSGMTNNYLPVVIQYPKEKEITETILGKLNAGHEDELQAPAEE